MNLVKKKRPLANWTKAFPEQHSALRPENTKAGGIKSRSVPEKIRMEIYVPIAAMFKRENPLCTTCPMISGVHYTNSRNTDDVHHTKGREGLLLFDIRWFLPVCRGCHDWIKNNPKKAVELGLDESHKQ